MVVFGPDDVGLADKSPCAGIRADLKMCLLASDCCKKEKKTPKDCLRAGVVPDECAQLRQIFFECKRSLIVGERLADVLHVTGLIPAWNKYLDGWQYFWYWLFVDLDNRRRFRGHKGY